VIRILAVPFAVASAALAQAGQYDDAAFRALVKALESQRDVRVTMVQSRSAEDLSITVTVQIVPNRGIRSTILQPLLHAGMVSLDNGELWRNYDPQLNELRIEKSPALFQLDIEFRKKMIEKNFNVTFDRDANVAGRAVRVVHMKGRHEGMSDRRLFIDSENSLILRYVVMPPEGGSQTPIDTMSVDLRSPIDMAKFEAIGMKSSKVIKAWGPVEVAQAGDARRYTGFEPVLPTELPAGLAKQAIHVVGTEARSFVGVRLTDGMAVVTVYMWGAKDGEGTEDEPFAGKYDQRSAGGVRIKVVGDATASVKAALARAFARAARD
jgi:hypothetical protein